MSYLVVMAGPLAAIGCQTERWPGLDGSGSRARLRSPMLLRERSGQSAQLIPVGLVPMVNGGGVAKPQGRPRSFQDLCADAPYWHTGAVEDICWRERLGEACGGQGMLHFVQRFGGRDQPRRSQQSQPGQGSLSRSCAATTAARRAWLITAVISALPSHRHQKWRTWRAYLITDLLSLAPLSSHATARTGRLAPRSKARPPTRPTSGSGASPSDLTNATAQPQRPQIQLGGYVRVRTAPDRVSTT
jgi:hypothetical protein